MHHIPKAHLEKFKELYKKEFGEDLTDDDAAFIAARFLNLMNLLQGRNCEITPSDFDLDDNESLYDKLHKKRV